MRAIDPLQTLRTVSYNRCMATRILTVEDAFDIKGRGLVVVPGPLVDAYAGPRQIPVRLILPNGDERTASMGLDYVFQTPPPNEHRLECILMGVAKADVPIGTEVWAEA
jgi:hypothetical protein